MLDNKKICMISLIVASARYTQSKTIFYIAIVFFNNPSAMVICSCTNFLALLYDRSSSKMIYMDTHMVENKWVSLSELNHNLVAVVELSLLACLV